MKGRRRYQGCIDDNCMRNFDAVPAIARCGGVVPGSDRRSLYHLFLVRRAESNKLMGIRLSGSLARRRVCPQVRVVVQDGWAPRRRAGFGAGVVSQWDRRPARGWGGWLHDGMRAAAETAGTPLTIRVLNSGRWPRDQTWTPSATYTGCLYHPYIQNHNHDNKSAAYREAFGRWGMWYLPP